MKVYVAGASKEAERVERAMAFVMEQGWELTLDWLSVIRAEGAANGIAEDRARRAAEDDLEATAVADVLWFLVPHNNSKGAWVELGYALALGIPIVASGNLAQDSIFLTLSAIRRFPEDEDALEHLQALGRHFRRFAEDERQTALEWSGE